MDFEGKLAGLIESIKLASLVQNANNLEAGTIVYVEMDKSDGLVINDGYPTRLKYVVIAGSKSNRKEVCALLVNSEADYSNDPDWRAEQYPLFQKKYSDILDHDSWLDCTDPKTFTLRKLKAKKAEIKGHLTDDDLRAVMTKLKNSEFIDNHTKKVYGIASFKVE